MAATASRNFALPDLQGRAPMHPGQGPGLSLHDLGETGGSETVTLLESRRSRRTRTPCRRRHLATAITQARLANAARAVGVGGNAYVRAPAPPILVHSATNALAPAGGDQPHNNLQPYLTFYFCIALQGVFPPRG